MSKWDSTHQSLLECENRMSNRPEQAHILCQWGGFQLNDCMTSSYVLLRSVKEELTLLKHCTVCSQSTLADTIWIRGCRLPGETMLRRTTVQGSSGRKGAKKKKKVKCNHLPYFEWKHHLSISMSLSPSFFFASVPLCSRLYPLSWEAEVDWMVTLLPPGNNILMLSGYVKQNSSISDFVARGRTIAAGTCW